MPRRRRIALLISLLLGLPLLLLAVAAVFIATFDGSGYRGTVESLLSDATGRACSIGSFRIDLSTRPRLRAEGITLANAGWSEHPDMITVRSLALELDAWSLLSGPLHVTEVAIDGVEVLLEVDPGAGPNWRFTPVTTGSDDTAGGGLLAAGLVVDRLTLSAARLSYGDAGRSRVVTVAGLEAGLDAGGELTLGLDGRLDEAPLELGGRLAPLPHLWEGGGVDLEAQGRLADARMHVSGSFADPLHLAAADLELELSGEALEDLALNLGLPALGTGPYHLAARVAPGATGVAVTLDADLDRFEARLEGQVDDPIHPARIEASVSAEGPDLARLGAWLGEERLPAAAFTLAGDVSWQDGETTIRGLEAHVGETSARGDGVLGPLPGLEGTDLSLQAGGPDLAAVGVVVGVPLPAGPFEVSGRLRRLADGYGFEGVDARLDAAGAEVDGRLALAEDGFTLTLDGSARGPDLAALMSRVLQPYLSEIPPLPAEAFTVAGQFSMGPDGYRVDGLQASLGDLEIVVTGGIGREPALDGLDATLDARAGSLDLLAAYVALPPLPAGGIALSGRITRQEGEFRLQGMQGSLGPNRFRLEDARGRLDELPMGLEADFEISGPDLSAFAGLGPDLALPALAYGAAGRVSVVPEGYRLGSLKLSLGDATASVDGLVGPLPGLHGTDVRVDSRGLLVAWIEDLTGLQLPAGSARVSGRMLRDETGITFDGVEVGLGDHRFGVHGRLGELPELIGTDLVVQAAGPSLAAWERTFGREDLPAEPYDLAARFEGTPASFRLRDLTAHMGGSDLAGSGSLDWGETPRLTARLVSHRLDLTPFIHLPGIVSGTEGDGAEGEGPAVEPAAASQGEAQTAPARKAEKAGRIFSDEPLDLAMLSLVDADVSFSGDVLVWQGQELTAAKLEARLQDGALAVDRMGVTGPSGARVSARLGISPAPGGHRITVSAAGDDLRFSVLGGTDIPLDLLAPYRMDVDLTGVGATPHELMSSLSGHVWVLQGAGRGDNHLMERLSSDLLLQILSILNPFVKQDEYSTIECGIYAVDVEDGTARLDALVLRTEKVTVGGHGRVNLENEKLDLAWTSKPRKGIGLSASSLVNSYIKLGGTLAQPQVEIKPLEAAVTTGVAVATVGLSIAARGLWDRLTAEKNPCKKGVPALEKRMAEEGHARASAPQPGR